MRSIDSSEDILDSREIIKRLEELEAELEEAETKDEKDTTLEELEPLRAFAKDACEVSDWTYGEAFVRDSHFQEYAEQLADDIGAIDNNSGWLYRHIDWEAAAIALQQDYTPYEFDDVTYWARA